MIDEQDVDRAVHWLVEHAAKAAQARAEREYLDNYTRVLKAQVMKEHGELPLGAQEREAYADKRYVEHLDALRVAVENDEKFRWLKTAAETRVSAWQSLVRLQRP